MSREIRKHNETVLRELKKGDAIEIDRGIYQHWALYVGDGQVIHLAGEDAEDEKYNACVHQANYWDVVGKSKACKNNSKDKKYSPSDIGKILSRAFSMIGQKGYNLVMNNCEHFVSYCRCGVWTSEQVQSWLQLISYAIGAVGAVAYAVFRARRRT